jgi:hypothetical protein
MPLDDRLGYGTTGLLSGAGGGLLYSLIAGDKNDNWKDHLRRTVIGAGIGGAAGLGLNEFTGAGGLGDPVDTPEDRRKRKNTGRGVGGGLASGLLSRAYGSGLPAMLGHGALGNWLSSDKLTTAQRIGLSAAQGAGMGLLKPNVVGGMTRGGSLKKRLLNAGSAAVYNMIASEAGRGAGGFIGERI